MSTLSHAQVQALLATRRLGRSLTLVTATGSTNDDARIAASAGVPDGHTIVADTQIAGRGSRGRTWLSPAGTDLYLSIVTDPKVPLASLPPLTLAVGLATAEALDHFLPTDRKARVKWPNDVWVERRKLAGILVESTSVGEHREPLVIGIGINVNRLAFPDDLAIPATSLARECGSQTDRAEVLAALLNRLERWLDRFVDTGAACVVNALHPRLALHGEWAQCDNVIGIVEGIAASGALRMRTASGIQECVAGTLRPCEGIQPAPG